ncbi:MAG: radical SAM family heme chaperone HemW [Clostridia bacterium]|nr:radical SAM family heme chaperone HemW [Clostridia bacterium]
MNRGLYIHVPFCESKCSYCNFYSLYGEQKKQKSEFTKKIISDLQSNKNKVAKTLYIGGGSPGSLPYKDLQNIIKTATESYKISGEKTIELNPVEVNENLSKALKQVDINRISLGVQTFNPEFRTVLGRKGDSTYIFNAVSILKKIVTKNISADLIIGLPNQTLADLQADLNMMKALDIPHISVYILKIEPKTAFYKMRKTLNFPNDDEIADMYLKTVSFFDKINLKQYEIANFAKNGYESKHNLNYWLGGEYYALGPSAHFYVNGKRYFYSDNLKDYLDDKPPIFDCDGGGEEEKLMLNLRLKRGISLNQAEKYKEKIDDMREFFEIRNNRVCLNSKGFLISNSIISELLS